MTILVNHTIEVSVKYVIGNGTFRISYPNFDKAELDCKTATIILKNLGLCEQDAKDDLKAAVTAATKKVEREAHKQIKEGEDNE